MVSKLAIKLAIVGAGILLAAAISVCLIWRVRRRRRRRTAPGQHRRTSELINGVRAFTYQEMAQATNNFSKEVGRGGYGIVYRGTLVDGTIVAIKRAQQGSQQGEREFLTEIQSLSRLHHRNLVPLIGYCDEEREQMLVYEFMENSTLRSKLSAHSRTHMSFPVRLWIALGSAKGIRYLHTEADPPIFHRDIKSSNILLDLCLTAKVADFGLSRLAPIQGIHGAEASHVSTEPTGTPGYIDLDYYLTHRLTFKSDVYSLGVVFLELLRGTPAISNGRNIVQEVRAACDSGLADTVIDRRMGSYSHPELVKEFLDLSLKCCQREPDARPDMREVVQDLEKIWYRMPESCAPRRAVSEAPRSDNGTVLGSSSSSNYLSAGEEPLRINNRRVFGSSSSSSYFSAGEEPLPSSPTHLSTVEE